MRSAARRTRDAARYALNPEPARARTARWGKENPERKRKSAADWYARNREITIARAAAWNAANPGRLAECVSTWQKANKGRKNTATAKRRAAILQRTPTWVDLGAIEAVYIESARLQQKTGVAVAVDHVIPLQGKRVSGLHIAENLRVITRRENSRKRNSFEIAA